MDCDLKNCNECSQCINQLEQEIHPLRQPFIKYEEEFECFNKHYKFGEQNPENSNYGFFIDGNFHCSQCVLQILNTKSNIVSKYYDNIKRKERSDKLNKLDSLDKEGRKQYILKSLKYLRTKDEDLKDILRLLMKDIYD